MGKKINQYEPKTFKVSEKTDFTSDTFLLKVPCSMHPEPGQFVEVSVMGIGECPISVCSYSKNYIELLIRNVGNVTGKLALLKKGNSILIRGPYGHGYPMKDMVGKDIVIIAGGTGTAPPRSVIEYIEKNREKFHQVTIFMGFRDPTEVLFKDDIEKWSKQFNVTLCVDKCEDPSYSGQVGFVTDIFAKTDLSNENTAVIVCGPPIMMKIAIEKLKNNNFDDNQIFLSFERHMKCGVGKCGHCNVAGKYMCKDGPVFAYDTAKHFYD
jgi:anaerobic sulfite reductase subunit B